MRLIPLSVGFMLVVIGIMAVMPVYSIGMLIIRWVAVAVIISVFGFLCLHYLFRARWQKMIKGKWFSRLILETPRVS